MFEFFKHISDLIFDNSKSWGKRTSRIFAFIFFLILADLTFNISFNIFTENKLSQLEKITKLKDDYKDNSTRLKEIKYLESEIFKREHYSEFISRNLDELTLTNNENIKEDKIEDGRSTLLMILSSNTVLIIIVFLFLLLPIFGGKDARQANFFVGFFSSLLFISFLISIVTIFAYQIPLINKNPNLNYLANFLIQLFFYFILYLIFRRKNKNVS